MANSLLFRLSDNHPLSVEDDYFWEPLPYSALLMELKMLLMSSAHAPDIENIPYLNSSVLNYGVKDFFCQDESLLSQKNVLESNIKSTIACFEPRLQEVSCSSFIGDAQDIHIIVNATYCSQPVSFMLKWNGFIDGVYLNE